MIKVVAERMAGVTQIDKLQLIYKVMLNDNATVAIGQPGL
jgi:hypothetical protein